MINYDRRFIEEAKKQLPVKRKSYFLEKLVIITTLFVIAIGILSILRI